MNLRRLLLRVMLGALAVAALAGVLAILFYHGSMLLELIGTAVMTAVAAGLLMVFSLLVDREKSRSAGLLGMVAVIAEFFLGLALIWMFDLMPEAVWVLMVAIGISLLPAMFFLRVTSMPRARLAGWTGLGVCAVTFLIFAITPWFNIAWVRYGEWCGTGVSIGTFGLLAAASLAGAGGDRRHWRYLGTLTSLAAAVMGIIGVWREVQTGEIAFAMIASTAAFIAHANLVLLCPLKSAQRWLAFAAIATSFLTALFVDLLIVFNKGLGGELSDSLLTRLAGASGILAGCSSLALLVLAALNRKSEFKPILAPISEYTLICPGCNRKQTLVTGEAQCPTCLLIIQATFKEPHCSKCGYLIFMLNSDRCPECGTPVRAADSESGSPAIV